LKSVVILSVPRSGSTWIGKVFATVPGVAYRFQPNFSYSFPYRLTQESTLDEYEVFQKALVETTDPFVRAELSISGVEATIEETSNVSCLIWKEVHFLNLAKTLVKYPETTVIALVRSPFAVLSSWLSVPKEFDPQWDALLEWRNGAKKNAGATGSHFGYEEWKKSTLRFLQLSVSHPNMLIICSYEALIADPVNYTKELFGRAGLTFGDETLKFLSRNGEKVDKDPYSTNKYVTRDDKWKSSLSQEIINEIKSDPTYKTLQAVFNWQE
jgi:hypothetical protein